MSEHVTVAIARSFKVTRISREQLEEQGDGLMRALLDLECSGISDPAVSWDLGESIVDIEIESTGESFKAAEEAGVAAIRAAIHTVGGATPNWGDVSGSVALAGV